MVFGTAATLSALVDIRFNDWQHTGSAIEVGDTKDVDSAALRGVKRTAEAGRLTLHVGGCSCRGDGSNGEDAGEDLHGDMMRIVGDVVFARKR